MGATSGINGAGTSTQKKKGVTDNGEIFLADTLKGGAKKPEIAKVMCYESGPGVEWLIEKFDLDLSLVARLGGHSQQRTHRGAERFPGMTITYALMQRFEKIAETSDRARIGAKTIDLEWVQVHPTGLVKPDDADAKVKFLAAEALRGIGGVLIDREGKRFANELGRRDYVTGRMWKNKPPFRL